MSSLFYLIILSLTLNTLSLAKASTVDEPTKTPALNCADWVPPNKLAGFFEVNVKTGEVFATLSATRPGMIKSDKQWAEEGDLEDRESLRKIDLKREEGFLRSFPFSYDFDGYGPLIESLSVPLSLTEKLSVSKDKAKCILKGITLYWDGDYYHKRAFSRYAEKRSLRYRRGTWGYSAYNRQAVLHVARVLCEEYRLSECAELPVPPVFNPCNKNTKPITWIDLGTHAMGPDDLTTNYTDFIGDLGTKSASADAVLLYMDPDTYTWPKPSNKKLIVNGKVLPQEQAYRECPALKEAAKRLKNSTYPYR